MKNAFRIVRRAFSIWWDSLMHVTLFNMLWILAQLLVVTGPPATAAMFVLAQRFKERDLLVPMDFFVEIKRLFVPAWKWGALNIVIFGLFLMNFVGSLNQDGELWFCLRYVWLLLGILWYIVNLFYWPLWLSQDDQRLVNTYRNSFVILLRMPITILTLSVIVGVLIMVSLITLFPLALALMSWLSLIGTLTIQWAVEEIGKQQE